MSKQTHAHSRGRERESVGEEERAEHTHNCFGSLIKGRELVAKSEHSMRLLWLFTLMENGTHTHSQSKPLVDVF